MVQPLARITTDELDDLIYYSRAGDLPGLQQAIKRLSECHSCSPSNIIQTAIDVDDEGLGSRACLLHYPAANGNLEIVQYLLMHVTSVGRINNGQEESNGIVAEAGASGMSHTSSASDFVNHQNVSGNTALHWAGVNGHLEIVQALIKAGADPEIVNAAGRDAVVESEWSAKDGAAECAVWMLRECGALEKGIGDDGVGSNNSADDVDGESHDQDHANEEDNSNNNDNDTAVSKKNSDVHDS